MRKDKALLLGAASAVIAMLQAPSASADDMATVGFIDAAVRFIRSATADIAVSSSSRAIARDVGLEWVEPSRSPAPG